MVLWDQLRISDNGKRMYINIHVNMADYFKDVYLESITIMTADKVLEASVNCPTEDFIYYQKFDKGLKEGNLVIDKGILDAAFINLGSDGNPINANKPYAKLSFDKKNFSSDLFFVYVKTYKEKETPVDPCLPCRFDEETTVGVTFDDVLLYQRVMDFTRELADDCMIPQGFTDFILLWNAFKASIETEHYIPAIKYYNMLFGNTVGSFGSKTMSSGKGCGCHG